MLGSRRWFAFQLKPHRSLRLFIFGMLAFLAFSPLPCFAFGRLEIRATPPVTGLDVTSDEYTVANGNYDPDYPPIPGQAAVEVISDETFKAEVEIFSEQGEHIRSLSFDMSHPSIRPEKLPGGVMHSLLLWDETTSSGQKVGHGVYLWKLTLSSTQSHAKSIRFLRMGVIRRL